MPTHINQLIWIKKLTRNDTIELELYIIPHGKSGDLFYVIFFFVHTKNIASLSSKRKLFVSKYLFSE